MTLTIDLPEEDVRLLSAKAQAHGVSAEDYARRHGVPRWYDDADRLIRDSEVDAVYIATPPGSHLEYALRVCAACKLRAATTTSSPAATTS